MKTGKDLEILKIIQADARTPNAEIARQMGMAPSAIHERVKKLEGGGVIQSYEARINPTAVGLNLLAFIFIKTAGGVCEWTTGQRLTEIPEVLEVHSIAGADCYFIKVRTRDTESFGHLLREKLGNIETITATNSIIALATLKETNELPLERDESETE